VCFLTSFPYKLLNTYAITFLPALVRFEDAQLDIGIMKVASIEDLAALSMLVDIQDVALVKVAEVIGEAHLLSFERLYCIAFN
jgi:hypothetical protein